MTPSLRPHRTALREAVERAAFATLVEDEIRALSAMAIEEDSELRRRLGFTTAYPQRWVLGRNGAPVSYTPQSNDRGERR
jgi:hypothetical protein